MYRRRGKRTYRRKYKRTSNKRYFAKRVRKILYNEAETKYFIQNIVNSSVSATTNLENSLFAGISIGTGNENRIGSRVAIKNVSINLTARFFNGTGTPTSTWCRAAVIWPKKGVSTGDLVLYLTASNPGVHARVDPDQYFTCYDRKWLISADGVGNGMTYARIKYNKYCKMAKIAYDNDGSIEGPILYIASDAGLNSNIRIDGYVSLSFKDI